MSNDTSTGYTVQELENNLADKTVNPPVFISRGDGTFSTILQTSVGKLPKKE